MGGDIPQTRVLLWLLTLRLCHPVRRTILDTVEQHPWPYPSIVMVTDVPRHLPVSPGATQVRTL